MLHICVPMETFTSVWWCLFLLLYHLKIHLFIQHFQFPKAAPSIGSIFSEADLKTWLFIHKYQISSLVGIGICVRIQKETECLKFEICKPQLSHSCPSYFSTSSRSVSATSPVNLQPQLLLFFIARCLVSQDFSPWYIHLVWFSCYIYGDGHRHVMLHRAFLDMQELVLEELGKMKPI